MKGVPIRIEAGPKDLEQGKVAVVTRFDGRKRTLDLEGIGASIKSLLDEVHAGMFEK